MGALNSSLVFGGMIPDPEKERQAEVEHQKTRECGLEVTMNEIVLFKILLAIIIQYFEVVL